MSVRRIEAVGNLVSFAIKNYRSPFRQIETYTTTLSPVDLANLPSIPLGRVGDPVFCRIAWSPEVWTCLKPNLRKALTASLPEILVSLGIHDGQGSRDRLFSIFS